MRTLAVALFASLVLPLAARAEEAPLPGEPPTWRFFEASEGLSLKPEQAAKLKELREAWQARHGPVRDARHLLNEALGNQVRAGSIDVPTLRGEIDGLVAAVTTAREGDAAALVELHNMLDPAQRQTLAGAIQDRLSPKGKAKAKAKKLADALELTAAQKGKLKKALADEMAQAGGAPKDEVRAETSLVRDAMVKFTTDSFTTADLPTVRKDRIEKNVTRRAEMAKAFVGVATPEQLGRLAAWLNGDQ